MIRAIFRAPAPPPVTIHPVLQAIEEEEAGDVVENRGLDGPLDNKIELPGYFSYTSLQPCYTLPVYNRTKKKGGTKEKGGEEKQEEKDNEYEAYRSKLKTPAISTISGIELTRIS